MEQLKLGMRMTLLEKLEWLEGTLEFARQLHYPSTASVREEAADYGKHQKA